MYTLTVKNGSGSGSYVAGSQPIIVANDPAKNQQFSSWSIDPANTKDVYKRQTDTMPQWAGSSWYYLRYTDPHNDKALASPEALKYWLPVDWYNGGIDVYKRQHEHQSLCRPCRNQRTDIYHQPPTHPR